MERPGGAPQAHLIERICSSPPVGLPCMAERGIPLLLYRLRGTRVLRVGTVVSRLAREGVSTF